MIPMLRQLFDKVRSSGWFEVDHLHHIRTSENRLTRKNLSQLQYMADRLWLEIFLMSAFLDS